jgi:hypothetical protein
MTITNQNCIHEEIKSRFKYGECLVPFGSQSFVFPSPLKNFEIKIYRTIMVPLVLYGCETWHLTLWKKHRLSMFENRVLRRIFGPWRRWLEAGEECIMGSFIT